MRAVFLVSILTISLISAGAQFSEIEFSSGGIRDGYFSDEASNSSMSNGNNSTDSDGDLIPDELDNQPNNPLIGNVTGGIRFNETTIQYTNFQQNWDGNNGTTISFGSGGGCEVFDYPFGGDNIKIFKNISTGEIKLNCDEYLFEHPQNGYDRTNWIWLNEFEVNYSTKVADLDNDGFDDRINLLVCNGRPCLQIDYLSEQGIEETFKIRLHDGREPESLMIGNIFIFDVENDGDLDIFIEARSSPPPSAPKVKHIIITNVYCIDRDYDSVCDKDDKFPEDPGESKDTDDDGIGDNTDVFPHDPSEWSDADGDGVGGNTDEFPHDLNEWNDSDGDGIGDNSDEYPNDSSRWKDTDNDGIDDNIDTDNDGIDDNIDTDIDGDGIPNSIEHPSSELWVFSFLLVISLLVIISNDFKS